MSYVKWTKPRPKGKDSPRYGTKQTEATKAKQSAKKQGENHPKFKGYYTYQGETSTSLNDLAKKLGTYPMALKRKIHQITFTPRA
jgi:hypothetical protein